MNKPNTLSSTFNESTKIAAYLLILFASPWLNSEPAVLDGEFVAQTVPDQKPGEYRVWVNDWNGGLYSRAMLFNVSEGEMLGSIETGWEGVKVDIPSKGKFVYNLGLYMSRGYHGERTDVLEYYDRKTLNLEGEIAIPPKAPRGLPNTNHSDLSDDERFLFVSFFTPASSVGIIDLQTRNYVGEIETAGCAYVMAGGDRRFFTLCGDGSLAVITVDDNGEEKDRSRLTKVFDPIADPLHGTGVRAGDDWYFVTQLGVVHKFDVSGANIEHTVLWDGGEKSGEHTAWVPAEMIQNLAVNETLGQLFLLVGDQDLRSKGGGPDYHRKGGTEVWSFDIASGDRLIRVKLPAPMYTMAVSQDAKPALYTTSMWTPTVYVFGALKGAALTSFDTTYASMNMVLQPVEAP